jgi:hypothetical protein
MKLSELRLGLFESLASKANKTDKNPTDLQKKAGNYKKGHVYINGLDISIENPQGSVRKGTDKNGQNWEVIMPNHYGYIKGTKGKDKDHLDVFLGPYSEDDDCLFFVIDQLNQDGKFDEHKIMMGFRNTDHARNNYLKAHEKDWKGLGAITRMTMKRFKEWLKSDTTKPVSL